jgi:hypothetical protein
MSQPYNATQTLRLENLNLSRSVRNLTELHAGLVRKLVEYGQHLPDCAGPGPLCTCGWREILLQVSGHPERARR